MTDRRSDGAGDMVQGAIKAPWRQRHRASATAHAARQRAQRVAEAQAMLQPLTDAVRDLVQAVQAVEATPPLAGATGPAYAHAGPLAQGSNASPVLVGPKNAQAVLGIPWRRARDVARRAGLRPVRLGRANCYQIDDLLAVLASHGESAPTEDRVSDPLADARAELARRLAEAEGLGKASR